MPEFLERDLASSAAKEHITGERRKRYIFGAMNRIGAMRGNKITAKGRRMEKKHASDVKKGLAR